MSDPHYYFYPDKPGPKPLLTRSELSRDVENFLKSGGQIKVVPPGVSGIVPLSWEQRQAPPGSKNK